MFSWFLGGLAIGFGFWFWSSQRAQRQLREILALFPEQQFSVGTPSPQRQLLRAVQALQQSEQVLHQRIELCRDILQAAPIGYLEVDPDNCLYWCNTKAAVLLNPDGQKKLTSPNPPLLRVIRSYELDRLIEAVRSRQSLQCHDWTLHNITSPTEETHVPIRGHGFLLQNGHIGVFLEIRAESVQIADERDRWTSDVAHELKTPLTSIRLLAETLQPNIEAEFQPWIERLIQETVRLSILVQDILELGQLELGKSNFQNTQALKYSNINLPGLIQRAWMTLEPLAKRKNFSLYYEGPDTYFIHADENRMLRVLLNLIDNSIKFSPVNQILSICLKPNCQPPDLSPTTERLTPPIWNQLDVIDAGPGFPEDSLKQVFKRFYKVDPSRGRTSVDGYDSDLQSGGSGLGLAIAYQIITAHGGTITAQNHPEQGGAWIQILMPSHPHERS